ncbi:MAG: CopG family transcriptional regulator [Candidatus Eisenbacteria bacterium]|nr:CopG family transcriptional regulator [Candidatus Eisenbacteria bacterium]
MSSMKKAEIITFKADQSLADALRRIPNRSEFIREALLRAMDSVCPLCHGTGSLTVNQKRHWNRFASEHSTIQCDRCQATYLVCQAGKGGDDV